jgi:two-component system, response regulator PdtaR
MRILVVEDEALIAMVLADCLEDRGHEVVGPAATAVEAVALCEAGPPELALLDIDLRDGGDGVVLARVLFARWRLPLIFTSGQSAAARRARDVALGHVPKPYKTETVLRCIEAAREVMDGGKPAAAPAGFELFSAAG